MKRMLWLGIGLAVGALVVRAVSKKARAYSPRGIAASARDSGRNLVDTVRDFVDDVRDGMHEREQELQAAFAEGISIDELDADLEDRYPDDRDLDDDGPGGAAARDAGGRYRQGDTR
jgi:hypothetical protein